MPSLKDVLVKQAGVPGNIEKNFPAGVPKMSQLLVNIATALPVNPILPELPVAPGATPQFSEAAASIIKGLEESMPSGFPLISETRVEAALVNLMPGASLKSLGEEILS